ncbi:hypothetical protein EYF80_058980 [Liparis tanakae]|uniref:Uncharacterized protein n=1 Tax=Liparis tanakae TaxID=230148 RepID=A0A4Z2EQH9_9TELE|nr:hypothetical protein EYF80_058980 [Liparis tanakae]
MWRADPPRLKQGQARPRGTRPVPAHPRVRLPSNAVISPVDGGGAVRGCRGTRQLTMEITDVPGNDVKKIHAAAPTCQSTGGAALQRETPC